MDGVLFTPLKQIAHPKGDIYHGLKASDTGYTGFGEAYFSFVNTNEVKGWKKHTRMNMNLVVPQGAVKFVVYDDRESSSTKGKFCCFLLSASENYGRLSVSPGLWMAFQGVGECNMLLNIADIPHDPNEALNLPVESFEYDWKTT